MTQLATRKKDYVWLYVVIAIGFSAVCWITGWLMARDGGYKMPIPANFFDLQASGYQNAEHRMIALIFQAATFGPLIGALVAAAAESGRVGLTELWRKLSAWAGGKTHCVGSGGYQPNSNTAALIISNDQRHCYGGCALYSCAYYGLPAAVWHPAANQRIRRRGWLAWLYAAAASGTQ